METLESIKYTDNSTNFRQNWKPFLGLVYWGQEKMFDKKNRRWKYNYTVPLTSTAQLLLPIYPMLYPLLLNSTFWTLQSEPSHSKRSIQYFVPLTYLLTSLPLLSTIVQSTLKSKLKKMHYTIKYSIILLITLTTCQVSTHCWNTFNVTAWGVKMDHKFNVQKVLLVGMLTARSCLFIAYFTRCLPI
jgi:hypothetical protein